MGICAHHGSNRAMPFAAMACPAVPLLEHARPTGHENENSWIVRVLTGTSTAERREAGSKTGRHHPPTKARNHNQHQRRPRKRP